MRANGFSFQAPASWKVERRGRTVEASGDDQLVAVTRFVLGRPYRPTLYRKAVPELNRLAERLATAMDAKVTSRLPFPIGSRSGRRYILRLRNGDELAEVVFLLRGRDEYQLLCRYPIRASGAACSFFQASFKPV